ncbi:hypothetical protein [Elioraea sp.]|uniref:hypothetical protein n=1 Tax=Elioraea sp. TaxID=2185103 RepID=UPI003F724C61
MSATRTAAVRVTLAQLAALGAEELANALQRRADEVGLSDGEEAALVALEELCTAFGVWRARRDWLLLRHGESARSPDSRALLAALDRAGRSVAAIGGTDRALRLSGWGDAPLGTPMPAAPRRRAA